MNISESSVASQCSYSAGRISTLRSTLVGRPPMGVRKRLRLGGALSGQKGLRPHVEEAPERTWTFTFVEQDAWAYPSDEGVPPVELRDGGPGGEG